MKRFAEQRRKNAKGVSKACSTTPLMTSSNSSSSLLSSTSKTFQDQMAKNAEDMIEHVSKKAKKVHFESLFEDGPKKNNNDDGDDELCDEDLDDGEDHLDDLTSEYDTFKKVSVQLVESEPCATTQKKKVSDHIFDDDWIHDKPKHDFEKSECNDARQRNENEYIPLNMPSKPLIFEILRGFYAKHGDFEYQHASYERFLHEYMPAIVQETNMIHVNVDTQKVKHVLTIQGLTICKPTIRKNDGFYHPISPEEAKVGNYTYSCSVFADVEVNTFQMANIEEGTPEILIEKKVFRNNRMWSVPCMVGSSGCYTNVQKGIFIINGHEKVCINQLDMRPNTPLVMPGKTNSGALYTVEIRSVNDRKYRSSSTSLIHLSESKYGLIPEITVMIPYVKFPIPLHAIFRILGVDSVEHMVLYVLGTEYPDPAFVHLVRSILEHECSEMTMDNLYEWIGVNGIEQGTKEQKARTVKNLCITEFMPHMGNERASPTSIRAAKAVYLGYVVRKLLKVYRGELPPDNRDDTNNLRLKTVGVLMALLFRQMYLAFHRTIPGSILRHGTRYNLIEAFTPKRITSGLNSAFSTGIWTKRGGTTQGGNQGQTGVIQAVQNMTYFSIIANLRRAHTGIEKSSKSAQVRQLNPKEWGLICPAQTPEGDQCGIVKNMASHCVPRAGFDMEETVKIVLNNIEMQKYNWIPTTEVNIVQNNHHIDWVCFFVNGRIIGYSNEADKIHEKMKELRTKYVLPRTCSLAFMRHLKEYHISTDVGCMMRPLFVVKRMHLICDLFEEYRKTGHYHSGTFWDKLLEYGVIDYVDKDEEDQGRVAVFPTDLDPRYLGTKENAEEVWEEECATQDLSELFIYCEIHPSTILGTSASLIPYSDFNQAPRNTYASAMMAQSKAVAGLEAFERLENAHHVLMYGQEPLVQTMQERITGNYNFPYGFNAVIAVMCYKGYTQEDAIGIKKGCLDRGMGRSSFYRMHHDEERNNGNNNGPDVEHFKKPPPGTLGMRVGNYEKLDPTDGLPLVGTKLYPGDAVIGKTIRVAGAGKEGKNEIFERDRSRMIRHDTEPSIVDKVVVTDTRDGLKSVHVRTRSVRIPVEGDKFAARHGQKGVIGKIIADEDMPFSANGIIPDIIVSPEALPSRMTQGFLMEGLAGKASCFQGKKADATPFCGQNVDELCDVLHRNGYERYGNETLMNGETGEMMEAKIYMGVVYYEALKHLVDEKAHARGRGPRHPLTRQPPEGKVRNGGLRFGEMERDTLISHGVAHTLQGRTNQSDATIAVICNTCGNIADKAKPSDRSLSGLHVVAAEHYCRHCESSENVHEVALPHTTILMIEQLAAMNVKTKLELKRKDEL